VVVEEPVACVGLTSVAIAGATGGYPGVYTFTTEYAPFSATLPIDYLWDDGGTADSSVRSLSAGTYTLSVQATNCEATTVSDTHTLVIEPEPACTPVSSIDLRLVSTGTLYVYDLVGFSVDLAPDEAAKPYSYTVDYGDGVSQTLSSSADPLGLSHAYTAAGAFTVQVSVWNCTLTEPLVDTLEVNVVEGAYTVYLPVVVRGD
jgi:PKD repeat protein